MGGGHQPQGPTHDPLVRALAWLVSCVALPALRVFTEACHPPWSCWVAGDGGVIKTTVKEGTGYERPSEEDEVRVRWVARH